jgi:hypothetical protein
MTTKQISAKEVHINLAHYLHERPDLGIRKAIAAHTLEPRNLFESEPHPRPQRWFVLLLLVASASSLAFAYFNFWH